VSRDESSATRVLRRPPFRHSSASLRSSRSHGSRTSLIFAFVANLFVAVAKFAAGLITGSAALLAEAAHSVADSTNEVMLGVSFRRSRRPPDAEHPFGYGGLRSQIRTRAWTSWRRPWTRLIRSCAPSCPRSGRSSST
jgi:Cation efflux family